jgi:ABC-type multidrug transport system ATPase subunit
MRLRVIAPDGSVKEVSLATTVVRMGRNPTCELAFDPAAYPKVSGEHARIECAGGGVVLTPLSRSNKTLLNDLPVETAVAIKVGDRIRLGYSGPTIELLSMEGRASKLVADKPPPPPIRRAVEGQTPRSDSKIVPIAKAAPPTVRLEPTQREEHFGATVQADPHHLGLLRGSLAAERFEIGNGGVIGRDREHVDFLLDHPHVSRLHAFLKADGRDVVLIDQRSANGTFVNGQRIVRPTLLSVGDRIDIGPFSLEFDGSALVSRSRSNNIEMAARNVRRVVTDRATGEPLTLLHDVSLVVRPREFVCLLGPSGSGKTTLLGMLSGRSAPDRGAVQVNGQDLHANFPALKQDIAVVPQRDVLHDSLAVGAALRYTAELRLPPDTRREEIESSVSDILEVVGLTKRRQTLIRHLSGGQVKRASLANELMAKPSLLFLDEVTSGLDEQTDHEMMELFRQVADSGKTVVCITHSLANVEATCHLIVILTEGGRLAFIGTPDEAKAYFGISRLGDVYRKLAERNPEQWQTDFRASPFYVRYVRDRFVNEVEAEQAPAPGNEPLERGAASPVRQAWILTRRYVSIWRGDPQALLAMLGQSLLVALLLGLVFGRLDRVDSPFERVQRSINLLFLLSVACFWFGCNNAAKELVKERVIFSRERDFNLRLDGYLVSKFVVLVLIALVQVALLFGIVHVWCGPPGAAVGQALTLAVLAIAGTALGLLISAFAKTEEVAAALVPVAVMPQIILAGVIAPLSGAAKILATAAVSVYSAENSLEALMPANDLMMLHRDQPSFLLSLAAVCVHVVLFTGATFALLWLRGRTVRSA